MPTSVGGDGGKGLPPYKQTSNADGTVGRHPHADTGGGYGGKGLPPYKLNAPPPLYNAKKNRVGASRRQQRVKAQRAKG